MRPERLEMSGFAPFRSLTAVDFAGLDLFALTGPTGAGKSSVIDAITFALYGSVARYDRRSVGPIISLGAAEARIRFDFEVEGRSYTAARVVRRTTGGGATTAEARFESEGEVLASGAAEVTGAVEALLGLGIDHFTRSVVLPQGEFAAFLHDTPAGQQDLVKALLDMGVLDSVRRLATERAQTATALAEQARLRLDDLADATEEADQQATARVAALEKMIEPVTSAETSIAEGEATAKEKVVEVERLIDQRGLLIAVARPKGVEVLAKAVAAAREALSHAEASLAEAEESLEGVTEEAERVPTRETLETAVGLGSQLDRARANRDSLEVDQITDELAALLEKVDDAKKTRDLALAALEETRTLHAVHALAAGLTTGDPCPVCRRALEADPPEAPADLEARQVDAVRAQNELDEATVRHRRAEMAGAESRATHQAAAKAVVELEERLAALPRGKELEALIASRAGVDKKVAEARAEVKAARQAQAECRRNVLDLETGEKQAWDSFSAVRDRVAAFKPPSDDRDDLAGAWERLVAWAGKQTELLDDQVTQVRAAAEDATAAVEKQRDELDRLLEDAGVSGPGSHSTRLAAAVATARARQERIREKLLERAAARGDYREFSERGKVATALGNHLKANRFEGWLLSEALATLVDGANALLADLTSGTYSLTLNDRIIEVVDHRNADEHRSVRSLSGGETFLVSLALALSLGEQLVNLSDRGGARLEAIFLDEGFGSLDAETLETVAAVVAELAAQGRIVGVVTHVKELADQIPVRFEIRTGPSGSTIERVER